MLKSYKYSKESNYVELSMDSSNIDDGHASCKDKDNNNEDEDNKNNAFVDDIVVDDDMDEGDVNDNTATAREIVTGCLIFGGQIQKQRIRTN